MVKRLQYLAGLIKEDLDLSYNPMSTKDRRINRVCLEEEFDLKDNPFSNVLYNPTRGYDEEKLKNFFQSIDTKPFSFYDFQRLNGAWYGDREVGFTAVYNCDAPMDLLLVFEIIIKPSKKGDQLVCYYIKLWHENVLYRVRLLPVVKKECENLPNSTALSVLKRSVKSKMESYYRTAINGIENKNSYVMSIIRDLKRTV